MFNCLAKGDVKAMLGYCARNQSNNVSTISFALLFREIKHLQHLFHCLFSSVKVAHKYPSFAYIWQNYLLHTIP